MVMVTLVWDSNYQIIEISQSLDDPVATQGSTAPMIYHHTNTIEEKSSRNHHPNKDIYDPVTVTNNNKLKKEKYLTSRANVKTDVYGGVEGVGLGNADVTA